MHILIAPDSFKGSATAWEAAEAMAAGVRRARPTARVTQVPLSDGGEGMAEIILRQTPAVRRIVMVPGPLGDPVSVPYGFIDGGATAVFDVASVIGLPLVPPPLRDPYRTSTEGVGHVLRDAVTQGARRVIVGLGGSSTVDGGTGMAGVLGFRFYAGATPLGRMTGAHLGGITRIDASQAFAWTGRSVTAACDVTNPLVGPLGAAPVFGPQKGATPAQVVALNAGLEHLAACIERDLGIDVRTVPSGGSAGGLGAALRAFCGAELVSGIHLVMETLHVREHVAAADLVMTGEGQVDRQTAHGKTVAGLLGVARALGKPVVIVAGVTGPDFDPALLPGVTAVQTLVGSGVSPADAMARAIPLIVEAAARAMAP